MVILRWIGWERKGGDELCEKEPSSEFAVDLDGRFSVPSEACLGCEVPFEDRSGVDVITLLPAHLLHGPVEICQFFLDDIVVIVIPGIAGDAVSRVGFLWAGVVVEGQADDCPGTGQDLAWVSPALRVAFEPLHVPRLAPGHPGQEFVGVPGPSSGRHPAVVKADPGGN